MPHLARAVSIVSLLGLCGSLCVSTHAETPPGARVIRAYRFDNLEARQSTVPSDAGEQEPLTYGGPEPFRVVAGRESGSKAARIDRGWFQAKPFEVGPRGVSVAIWFRKHGQGSELGNGRANGMFFAQGDGYWSGLRLWSGKPEDDLHFEIGRPKPGSAFGLGARGPVPDGVWNHLAAVWDRREMRVYLNGLLLSAAAYEDDYTPPQGSLRIGFAGAGIGSLKLDVDEFTVYDGPLPPAAILRQALGVDVPDEVAAVFTSANEAVARRDWPAAESAFQKLANAPGLGAGYRGLGRLGLAYALTSQNKVRDALAEGAALFASADTPDNLREMALRFCFYSERGVQMAPAPRAAYERLAALPELSSEQRRDVRLALAESYLREGNAAAAREQFQSVLASADLPAELAWNLRLQIGHCELAAKHYPQARAEYEKLAAQAEAPPAVRSLALLSAAHACLRARGLDDAAAILTRVADQADAPPHLRLEARERLAEIARLREGKPARDPAASRVQLPPAPQPAMEFYVAPGGSDDNPGTLEKPFATLTRARDAVRALRAGKPLPARGVAIVLRGGDYPIRETIAFSAEDSGSADAPLVIRNHAGETPRLTGGVVLKGFAPVTEPAVLARLPEASRGRVVAVDLKQLGVEDLGSIGPRGYGRAGYPTHPWVDLYFNGKPLELARWPNEGFATTGKVLQGLMRSPDQGKPGRFEYADDRAARWGGGDGWLFGYWAHLWAGNMVKIGQVDPASRTITTASSTGYGFREGMPYYAFNLLEELDAPGEWYLDRATGLLYLDPPGPPADAKVEMPLLSQPFLALKEASHVTVRGLTFDLGRAEGVVVTGGENVLLAGCTLRRLGTNGVIVAGGKGHGVLGCDILTVGAGGVRMTGGDTRTLQPAGHFVENCQIADFTRVDRAYAPAVQLEGVGNRIAHNLMYDSPHHAMRVEGFDHVIEYNEIHSVVYESDDQSGIDIFGNPAYRGLVIRYNYWHHIGSGKDVAGQAGIRLDDFISGVLMVGNVFYRSAGGKFGGIQIHGGKDNVADNNLFIECKAAVSFSPWGQKRWEDRLAELRAHGGLARNGADVTQPPFSTRYPDLAEVEQNADRNFLWRNAAVRCGSFAARDRGVNVLLDNVAYDDDPGFVDLDHADFTLRADAPLYDRMALRPIPFREMGLYPDANRASWPVQHSVSPKVVQEYP